MISRLLEDWREILLIWVGLNIAEALSGHTWSWLFYTLTAGFAYMAGQVWKDMMETVDIMKAEDEK